MLYLEFLNYKNYNCFAENSSSSTNFLECGRFGWVRFVFGMMTPDERFKPNKKKHIDLTFGSGLCIVGTCQKW